MLVESLTAILCSSDDLQEAAMSATNGTETFQIPLEAAEAYEERFVPALFAEWAEILVDAAGIVPGMDVLDVACGTGIVTRTIAERLAGRGSVTGLDLNEAMLIVARRVRPDIDFRQGDVAEIPFADASFDVVTCSMALFFFPDRGRAVREMARVARPGGTVTIVVPSSLDTQPAWKPFVDVAARHAGPEAVSLLSTYWSCGDLDELRALFESSGLRITAADTRFGTARYPSVDAFVTTEVETTPLIERISDDVYRTILEESRRELDPFTTSSGAVEAPIECHVVVGHQS